MTKNDGNIKPSMNEEPKKKPTTPWKPAAVLDVTGKKPGYRYHFCSPQKVSRRQMEHWEVCKQGDGESVDAAFLGSIGVDGVIRKNELILMRIPEESAQSRDQYYSKMSKDALKTVTKNFKDVAPSGKSYGDIKITNETSGE